MRCKKHPSDSSSSVGVCSSCLRDRLFAIVAAQEHHAHLRAAAEDRHAPPLAFPRSVSPYVSRRKSDGPDLAHNLDLRFYSTPQIGVDRDRDPDRETMKKAKKRLSFLSGLFRTRSDSPASDSRDRSHRTGDSSPSWLSALLHSRRKKPPRHSIPDRGMSPEQDDPDPDPDRDRFSALSSETSSPQPWRRTPARGRHGHGRSVNVAGLAFCLSPLVRASPSRHWKQNGAVSTPEMAYSGEVKPHISAAASFCANRSRKIADFGRANRNR